MKDILQDIMIINFDGKTLAGKVLNLLEIAEIMGMLISALTSFAEKIHEQGLSSFEFTKLRFDLFKRNNILFVGSTSKKIKQKKALKALEKVATHFFSRYPVEILRELNGDLQIFSEFEKELALSKKEMMMEFIDAHWPSH